MREIIVKTKEEIKTFKESFNFKCFSLDTETTSLNYSNQELEGISLCDGSTIVYIDFVSINDYSVIKDCFPSELISSKFRDCIVICHNCVFDFKVLKKYGLSFNSAEWFDTMVAHHLIDENSKHGLKELANKILGYDIVSYEVAKKSKELFYKYALNDALWTWELAILFSKELKEQSLEMLFRKIEMPFLRVIIEMETNGFLVDKEEIVITKHKLRDLVFELEKQMLDILGEKYVFQYTLTGEMSIKSNINFNSTEHLNNILFKKLGLQPIETTKTGKNKTNKKTLNILKGKHEFIEILEQYKTAQKLLNSFYETLENYIDPDTKIRTHFNDTGTRTGRLSSNSPNLQQLPKKNESLSIDVRKCFIASPGKKLIVADYSGQELRVLAQISNDTAMIEAFKSGKDFHQETANQFGVSRTIAKSINFGVAYGKSAKGFSNDWNCTEEEAQQFLDKYFNSFSGVKKSIDECAIFLRRNGYIKSLTGRRRRFSKNEKGYYPSSAYRQAFNFLIQGFSADMIRIAGIKLLNLKHRNPEWKMNIIACIHDEYVFEVTEKYINEAKTSIKETMESVVNFKVPIISEIGEGYNYGEAK